MEQEQVKVPLFHYSLTSIKQLNLSSSLIIECNRNQLIWVCSIIHSLPPNSSTSDRRRSSSATGTSQSGSVLLFTHSHEIVLPLLVLHHRVQQEQANVTRFHYSLTPTKQLKLFSSSFIVCNRNQLVWVCSIIHSLPRNSSISPRPSSSSATGTSQCDSVPLFTSLPTSSSASPRRRSSSATGTCQCDSVSLFTHSHQTAQPLLVVDHRVQHEQANLVLFHYRVTSTKHLNVSLSWTIDCNRNKPIWVCPIINPLRQRNSAPARHRRSCGTLTRLLDSVPI